MITLPKQLKAWTAFIEGQGYAGKALKAKLPVIEYETDEFSAGAMSGKVAIEKGLKLLTLSLELAEPTPAAIKTLKSQTADGIKLRLQGSYKSEAEAEEHSMKVWMRGTPSKLDMGDWDADEGKPLSIEFNLTYYKVEFKGEVLIEIDTIAMIEIMGGTDRMAQRRAHLGG